MTFTTTELKIRKVALNTILTATHPILGPIKDQFDVIKGWDKSAARIIIHTNETPDIAIAGARLYMNKTNITTLADMIRGYVVQIPGAEVFAIAAPNVEISPDQKEFFAHVEYQKMERSWAAWSGKDESGLPKVFIITAPVLPHILRDLPNNLTFGTNAWARWLHDWLSKFMLQHRYIDASRFNLTPTKVVVMPEIATQPVSEPVLTPTPAPAVSTPAPEPEAPKIAKKRGRPAKKVAIAQTPDF